MLKPKSEEDLKRDLSKLSQEELDHLLLNMCFSAKYNINIIKILLKFGANVNTFSGNNVTPLMYASHDNEIESVVLFIKNNANINFKDNSNTTALKYAISQKNIDIAELLKQYGAKE